MQWLPEVVSQTSAPLPLSPSLALGRFRRIPATQLAAVRDPFAEVGPVEPGTPEEEDGPGDHAHRAVGPAVAPHQRRGDAEHAEADGALAAEAALGARTPAALAPEARVLGEP